MQPLARFRSARISCTNTVALPGNCRHWLVRLLSSRPLSRAIAKQDIAIRPNQHRRAGLYHGLVMRRRAVGIASGYFKPRLYRYQQVSRVQQMPFEFQRWKTLPASDADRCTAWKFHAVQPHETFAPAPQRQPLLLLCLDSVL